MKTLLATTAIVLAVATSVSAEELALTNDYKTTITKGWTQTYLDNYTDRNVIKTVDHDHEVSVTSNGVRLESEASGSDDTFVSNEVYTNQGGAGLYAYDWAELEDGTEVENETFVHVTSTGVTIESDSVTINGEEVATKADLGIFATTGDLIQGVSGIKNVLDQDIEDNADDIDSIEDDIKDVKLDVATNAVLAQAGNQLANKNADAVSELEGDLDDTNSNVKANAVVLEAAASGVLANAANIETLATATSTELSASLTETKKDILKAVVDGDYAAIATLNVKAAEIELALTAKVEEETAARKAADEKTHDRISQIRDASIYHDSRIESKVDANSARIDNNSARIDAVSAQAAAALNALSSAPSNGVGVAIGQAGGSTAVAIGVKKQLNDRWTFSASASKTSGQATQFGIGFGFTF